MDGDTGRRSAVKAFSEEDPVVLLSKKAQEEANLLTKQATRVADDENGTRRRKGRAKGQIKQRFSKGKLGGVMEVVELKIGLVAKE